MPDTPGNDFRESARAAADWVAEYLNGVEALRVAPSVSPGEIVASLPEDPPLAGEPLSDIMLDFESKILPGITHWNHPAFFGYFATSASEPGIVAELLTAALDVKAMMWKTSPAATELEIVTVSWLRKMLGLPDGWFGMTTDTASMSSMLALAAAREAPRGLDIRERGMSGRADLPRLRVYASEEAHSSIDKSVIALGLGLENLVRVPVDNEFRMRTDALAVAIAADRAEGYLPLACIATVGTTSTASVDPVPAIARICTAESVWLHVDAAYAGIAAISPAKRHVLRGCESADSLVVNPHKWMFTPFDCSVLYVKQPKVLKRAFALTPEYLTTREQDSAVNFMDYGVQLGRRFRALKLWMVIRALGVQGIAERVEAHCRMARNLADTVAATSGWVVPAPVDLGLVCLRRAPAGLTDAECDALNERIMHRVNDGGRAFISHTKLRGRYTLRVSIGNLRTEQRHVDDLWALLLQAAEAERHR